MKFNLALSILFSSFAIKLLNMKKSWDYQKAKIAKGICPRCKKLPLLNSKLCEEHYLKQKSAQHLGTTKYWKDLKNIFDNQQELCPYTNEKLILGKNVALDHIFSKKDFPEKRNDINNFQWLSYQANLIKSSLSHDQLIDFCIKVANKYKK